jgi:hypothetical protein
MKEVLTRALRALAVSPLNCSLILDAGGLDPLTDMLCRRDQELAHQAVVVMSLLTKVSQDYWHPQLRSPDNLFLPMTGRHHHCPRASISGPFWEVLKGHPI